jgi:hypothetical protein
MIHDRQKPANYEMRRADSVSLLRVVVQELYVSRGAAEWQGRGNSLS